MGLTVASLSYSLSLNSSLLVCLEITLLDIMSTLGLDQEVITSKDYFFPPSVLINCKSLVSRELCMRQRNNVLEELSCSTMLSLELDSELIQQIINLGSSQTCEKELKANLLPLF